MNYFDISNDLSALPIYSDYIASLLKKTKKVKRFIDPRYPKGMINDTVFEHVYRLRLIARKLILEPHDLKLLDRILVLHDIPEISTGDTTVLIKLENAKDTSEERELTVAHQLFSSQDLALYLDFLDAEKFLKGKKATYKSDMALLAKILDACEGSVYFHCKLAKWLQKGNTAMPHTASLEYFFTQLQSFAQRLKHVTHMHTRKHAEGVLSASLEHICMQWQDFPKLMPTIIVQGLKDCKHLYNLSSK